MIDPDDVKAHLSATREGGEALPWDDDTIAAVLRAEHAAQQTVCDIPSPRSEALDKALLRRVAVNLEQTNGEPLLRVGSTDPEVRELEKPHSLRRAPERDDPTPKNGGRARRSASTNHQSRKD